MSQPQDTIADEDRCVGLAEASKRFDVCVRTLTREIQRGRLRAFRVGRKWKIQLRELRRYMDAVPIGESR